MDFRSISQEVYDLANSNDPLAAPVKEALKVIDDSLDIHRWVELALACKSFKHVWIL